MGSRVARPFKNHGSCGKNALGQNKKKLKENKEEEEENTHTYKKSN